MRARYLSVIMFAVKLCPSLRTNFLLDFLVRSFLDFRVRIFHNLFQNSLITLLGTCALY